MEERSGVDEFLDESFGKKNELPQVAPKYEKNRISKIEKAGKEVMEHLLHLAKSTDLSYSQMAKRINEIYDLDTNKQNVSYFFKSNMDAIKIMIEEQTSLNKIRSDLIMEHNGILVSDIKIMDEQISKLKEDTLMDVGKRAKLISEIIDKKGMLLMRHAKLSGKVDDRGNVIDQSQHINIYGDSSGSKSDIINRLKKVNFKLPEQTVKPVEDKVEDKIIDVEKIEEKGEIKNVEI